MSDVRGQYHHQRRIPLMVRVNVKERDALSELARRFDRSLSREIARAILFYITHFDEADRAVQAMAGHEASRRGDSE